MAKPDVDHVISYKLNGIPCQIGILHYLKVEPNYNTWDSRDDYYGFTECDWMILDRKGYYAEWLERKITSSIEDDINDTIEKYIEELRAEAEIDSYNDYYDDY